MNLNIARSNMVQQQVRPWDVLDERVLGALSSVPREIFIPKEYQQLAYSDMCIPIGHDQVILPPKFIGRLIQALQLDALDTVLEIGTGVGYLTALLAKLTKKVISVEMLPELSEKAASNLKHLGIKNAHLETGNAMLGWPKYAPYDVIVLTGSVPYLPKDLREQLSLDGRLFAVIGDSPAMSAVLLTRLNKDQWTEQLLFETVIPPLINAPTPSLFQF